MIVLVLLLLALPASVHAQSSAATVKLGLVGKLSGYWPLWTAIQGGFLERENLKLEITYIDTDARLTYALVSGGVDVVANLPFMPYTANQQGADLRLFSGLQNIPYYRMVASKDVTSMAQLKGKRIGVSEKDTGADSYVIQEWLTHFGLRLDRGDYTLVNTGGLANRVAALKAGGTEATALVPPFDLLTIAAGFNDLGQSPDVVKHFQWTTFIAKASWLKSRSADAVAFSRAIVRAARFLQDPANKARAIRHLVDGTGVKEDLATTLHGILIPLVTKDGSMDPEGLAPWAKYVKATPDDLRKLVDDTYLKQAQASAR
jgi:ABC-type nitrate/sulfonate/bicarbonate transport system substrate-binding protein